MRDPIHRAKLSTDPPPIIAKVFRRFGYFTLVYRWEILVNTGVSRWPNGKNVTYGLLYGSYGVKCDDKKRLLIPAEIRQSIIPEREANVFVVVGHNRKIWVYPDKYYEELVTREPAELLPADAALDFDHLHFSSAHKIAVDKQCRVLLPEALMKRTGTQLAVTVIGSRDHLEVWNTAEWEAHLEDLDRRRDEIADQKRKGSGQTTPA